MLILADVRDIDTELWGRSEDTEGEMGEVCVDDETADVKSGMPKLSLWKFKVTIAI